MDFTNVLRERVWIQNNIYYVIYVYGFIQKAKLSNELVLTYYDTPCFICISLVNFSP